jgi:hypothetical protein
MSRSSRYLLTFKFHPEYNKKKCNLIVFIYIRNLTQRPRGTVDNTNQTISWWYYRDLGILY